MRWQHIAISIVVILILAIGAFVLRYPVMPPQLDLPERATSYEEIGEKLQQAVEQNAPPGIAVSVIDREGIQYAAEFGVADVASGREIKRQSVFQWWSLTKLFTMVAIVELEEQGKLSLDDRVQQYVPFFELEDKAASQSITIKQLLSHSSGLKDVGPAILGWVHFDGDPHPNQTEFLAEKLPDHNGMLAAPGAEGHYSNMGYLVLAAVIEKASGAPYEQYVTEAILEPLGMDRTGFVYSDLMAEDEAIGTHPRDFMSLLAGQFVDMGRAIRSHEAGMMSFNHVYSDQKGATGLIGPIEDLEKFLRLLLNGGVHDGQRLIKAQNVDRMVQPIVAAASSPVPDSEGVEFGLSFYLKDTDQGKVAIHGGGGMGHVAMIRLYPDAGKAVIALANSTYLGRTMGDELAAKLGAIAR
ncbi:beta-lactamase [Maritalea myrionectae]|uniref:Beta-lactamase n=1 Tax=Maritalea myrionectae TaxID=454601 RepID=A0A2R4MD48_9HYPH|nr:serine hydrolase domain-containing protein [Maritalea myrionectae]AVX03854.1 beta-lactamase [Maritalea myrionectae]